VHEFIAGPPLTRDDYCTWRVALHQTSILILPLAIEPRVPLKTGQVLSAQHAACRHLSDRPYRKLPTNDAGADKPGRTMNEAMNGRTA
jgi:hypothetical protein